MSNKNEELATRNSGFLALSDFSMDATMTEELEGLDGGFDRVKIPSGGATMFELPGDEADEPEMVKEFSAVNSLKCRTSFCSITRKNTPAAAIRLTAVPLTA